MENLKAKFVESERLEFELGRYITLERLWKELLAWVLFLSAFILCTIGDLHVHDRYLVNDAHQNLWTSAPFPHRSGFANSIAAGIPGSSIPASSSVGSETMIKFNEITTLVSVLHTVGPFPTRGCPLIFWCRCELIQQWLRMHNTQMWMDDHIQENKERD